MTPQRKGLMVALLHVAIVSSLGVKLVADRASYPRVWARTAPVDPNLPIRGRYVRLRIEAEAGPGLALERPAPVVYPNGATWTPPAPSMPVALSVTGERLVAMPASGWRRLSARPARDDRTVVLDPEGQWVEIVAAPGAGADTLDRFEVGLTVSDIEKSRAYYRSFIGLAELPEVPDEVLGTKKYPFRHGTMTVNLWPSSGPGRPAAAPSAGIQYVIRDVEAVDAMAKVQHVKVDRPLGNFGAGLRTLWLMDPDDITNYFAQVTPRPPTAR